MKTISDEVMPDHTIMHVQYSNAVTIWQRVLKAVVNTSDVHNKLVMCLEQR